MKFSLSSYKNQIGALSPSKVSTLRDLNHGRSFIETGTYLGDSVFAMRDVFEAVYSIELSESLYRTALERFADDPNVRLLCGDSSEKLREAALLAADDGAIFWLDAHWSGGNTARAAENTPIVNELKSIQTCQLGAAITIVDDMRYFAEIPKGFDVHEANYGYPQLRDLLAQVRDLWPTHKAIVNGDLLFIFPRHIYARLDVSDVLMATNQLRCGEIAEGKKVAAELIVAAAEGEERETILSLPDTFKHSLGYGIGGDYLYWRALVLERDQAFAQAKADFDLARKCGVSISPRLWE